MSSFCVTVIEMIIPPPTTIPGTTQRSGSIVIKVKNNQLMRCVEVPAAMLQGPEFAKVLELAIQDIENMYQ